MNLSRCLVVQSQMGAFPIVEPNTLPHRLLNFVRILETSVQSILQFENAVHPFGEGIVVAVSFGAHTGDGIVVSQHLTIAMIGLPKSSSPIPVARHSEREAAASGPLVVVSDLNGFICGTCAQALNHESLV